MGRQEKGILRSPMNKSVVDQNPILPKKSYILGIKPEGLKTDFYIFGYNSFIQPFEPDSFWIACNRDSNMYGWTSTIRKGIKYNFIKTRGGGIFRARLKRGFVFEVKRNGNGNFFRLKMPYVPYGHTYFLEGCENLDKCIFTYFARIILGNEAGGQVPEKVVERTGDFLYEDFQKIRKI